MMNVNEFLIKLVGRDYEVKNLAFNEDNDEFIDLISNFQSKLAVAISSSFFNKNINLFSYIKNINNIKSIFSLPIYKDSSNIILVILDSSKTSGEFILIDESDSLIHNVEMEIISDEIADELINKFKQSDNRIYLDLNALFKNNSILRLENNDLDENLNIYDEYSENINYKMDHSLIQDNNLDLNEAKNISFKNEEDFEDDELLDLFVEDKEPLKKRVMPNKIVDEDLIFYEKKFNQKDEMKKMDIPLYDGLIEINSSNIIKELSYPKKRQNPRNMLKKNNKPLIDGKVQFRKISKIADLQNIDKKNTKNTLLISTCKLCDSKLVHYNHDIKEFDDKIFIEISNIHKNVSVDYLYEYLNSNNGIDELLYYSKGYNYIRADLIKAIEIPIPPLEIQKEIVKTSREAREFFKTVDLLKKEFNSNILDYKHVSQSIKDLKGNIGVDSETGEVTELPRSWRHAYQGLIWPLAISYLSATKGGFEIVEKKDNYLKLFEFIAAFNAIILLSGLPEEVYLKNFNNIWTDETLKMYKSMTFGTWVVVSNNLAKVYTNNNFTSPLDEEFFEKIRSNKLLDALNESKNYRNKEFHGAIENAYEAKKIIEILDGYLKDIFEILEVYSNYKLIYTTGNIKATKQQNYIHDVILLNGPCAQPIYDKIIFDKVLMSESLYLYNPKNNKKLLINDKFMKFMNVDENKKHWALFIYNNCDKNENKAFYKCFQSKERDHKEFISSFRDDILLGFYKKYF